MMNLGELDRGSLDLMVARWEVKKKKERNVKVMRKTCKIDEQTTSVRSRSLLGWGLGIFNQHTAGKILSPSIRLDRAAEDRHEYWPAPHPVLVSIDLCDQQQQ